MKACSSVIMRSSLKEERLGSLRQRLEIQCDGSCLDHQDALRHLWQVAYPNREIPPLKYELWKEMGWQGCDPSIDFRILSKRCYTRKKIYNQQSWNSVPGIAWRRFRKLERELSL
ncbi:hypothetical protein ZIOFF_011604 [Zingiber officinale]|uniref:ELMO domain-containing protein n=1 Tax=Zingiber officinale TaxID=94328 RepID=A0A8J5HM93_ZINOF|nr:hypothetical protein ZIOFF_011604 [Zingiber officinale]